MSKDGGGSANTVSEFKPPDYTQDLWKDYTNLAGQAASTPYTSYQGMTVAPMNGTQQAAVDMTTDRAMNGAPDLNQARASMGDMAGGAYVNSNPYVNSPYVSKVIQDNANQMAAANQAGTAAQTDSAFARQGAFGGSAYQNAQAQNTSNLNNQVGQMANQYQLQNATLGSQSYQNDMGNMLSAANTTGNLSQDDWKSIQAMMGAGNDQQTYQQNLLNASQNAFNQQQMYPQSQLDALGNALSRASGGVGTNSSAQTTNQTVNPLTGLLGLGGLGYGLYNSGMGNATP